MQASREEIVELIGEVEPSFIARTLETGASVDEIAEAIADLEGQLAAPHVPSSVRVAEVREILAELVASDATLQRFPIRDEPVERRV